MILEQIKLDQLDARKKHNSVAVSLLTTLYSEASMVGKNATPPRDTTDAETIATIKKFLKNVHENIRFAGDRRNGDWLDTLTIEQMILESYLPVQFSSDQLKAIIIKFATENGITTSKGTGLIMQHLKNTYEGLYDGKTASDIVKRVLTS
jgi:hypothetical protein